MKKVKLLVALCLAGSMANAQVAWPGENWIAPPNNFNTSVDPPTNTGFSSSVNSSNPYSVSNGAFDVNGNLKFYVQDLAVYTTSSSSPAGYLPTYTYGSGMSVIEWQAPSNEIEIVPVPGNCNQWYVIYGLSISGVNGTYSIYAYVMVDCTSGTPVVNTPSNFPLTTNSAGSGLAVSKQTTSSKIRYLFTASGAGILRYTIGAWNSGTSIGIPSSPTTITSSGASDLVFQLELSPDQTRLAWNGGGYNYYNNQVCEVVLTSSYGYSSFNTYTIPGVGGLGLIYGLQYAQPTSTTNRLYVAATNGITYFTPGSSPTYVNIASSTAYGNTQLQRMATGNIMGLKSGYLYEINVGSNTIAASSNTTPIYSNKGIPGVGAYLYHLPDGLDMITSTGITASITNMHAINGNNITAQGNYVSSLVPGSYSWSILQCNSDGSTYTGGTPYSWSSGTINGTPSGVFTFPGTSSLACNTYYLINFSVNNCANTANATQQMVYTTLDANFTLSGTHINPGTYTATAVYPTDNPTGSAGFGYWWDVAQLTGPGGTVVSGTEVNNPSCWWTYPTNNTFNGYNGTSTLGSCSNVGDFTWGDYYQICFGVWSNACAWTETCQTLALCGLACRTEENPEGVVISSNQNIIPHSAYLEGTATSINTIKMDATPLVNIYPNPNTGNFIVGTNSSLPQLMQVFDVNGKMVLSQTLNGNTSINANNLPDGVYNINITGNNSVANKKLVIVR